MFETGTNVWRKFAAWPSPQAQVRTLYFHRGGRLAASEQKTLLGRYRGDYVQAHGVYFRRAFPARGDVRRARLYVSGLGLCEILINGLRIGDRVLEPAATDYRKAALYAAYDVTDSQTGEKVGALRRKGFKSILRDEWLELREMAAMARLPAMASATMMPLRSSMSRSLPPRSRRSIGR